MNGASEGRIPRLSPMASPIERRAALANLRAAIQSGTYTVDPSIVAVAVLVDQASPPPTHDQG